MNQDIKERWVEALRSGDYDQTTERLHDPDGGFCCLGVLCDVVQEDVEGKWEHWNENVMKFTNGTDDSGELLPRFVADHAGLDRKEPRVPVAHGDDVEVPTSLTELNDGIGRRQRSFDEIADLIEASL